LTYIEPIWAGGERVAARVMKDMDLISPFNFRQWLKVLPRSHAKLFTRGETYEMIEIC